MNDKRKIDVQKNIIDSLKSQVMDITEENNKLRKQNADLKAIVESAETAYKEYKTLINELMELKDKYNDALVDVLNMKSEYTKKFKEHLKRIRKQK